MKTDITQNDLVLLAYNELNLDRKSIILKELEVNPDLMDQFRGILSVQSTLNSYYVQPNPTSLQIILEESSSAMEVL